MSRHQQPIHLFLSESSKYRDSSPPRRRHEGRSRAFHGYPSDPNLREYQDNQYFYEEGQTYDGARTHEDNHEFQDYSGSRSYQTRSISGSALQDISPHIPDRRPNYQGPIYGSVKDKAVSPWIDEDREISRKGCMHLEDAFIYFFIRNYRNLDPGKLATLWSYYIADEDLGIELTPETDHIIYKRYWFLHREAYFRVERSPDGASKSEEQLNHAAVQSLDRACEATYLGKSYRWSDPTLVKNDWAKIPRMNTLEYHCSNKDLEFPQKPGYAKRLQVDRR